jgi:hypothetical protein
VRVCSASSWIFWSCSIIRSRQPAGFAPFVPLPPGLGAGFGLTATPRSSPSSSASWGRTIGFDLSVLGKSSRSAIAQPDDVMK